MASSFSSGDITGSTSLGASVASICLSCNSSSLSITPPQVLLDGVFLDGQFGRRLDGEGAAVLGAVEVEGIHEHAVFAGGHDVDAHRVERQVLGPAADAITPIAERHHNFIGLHVRRSVLRCGG